MALHAHFQFTFNKEGLPMPKQAKQTVAEDAAASDKKPTRGKNAANRLKFTQAELKKLATSNHHRQQLFWDTVQKGLCVLVSKGPKGASGRPCHSVSSTTSIAGPVSRNT
jgi:hypothetical protein